MLTKRSQSELAARIVAEIQPLLQSLRPQLSSRSRLAKLLEAYESQAESSREEKPTTATGRRASAQRADDDRDSDPFDDELDIFDRILDNDEAALEVESAGGKDDDIFTAAARRSSRVRVESSDDEDDDAASDPLKKARMAWLSIWYRVDRSEIAKEWQDFERFVEDVGTPPRDTRTRFTRLDSKRPYGPGNCAWRPVAREAKTPQRGPRRETKRANELFEVDGRLSKAVRSTESQSKRRSYRTRLDWQGRSLTINEWAQELGFSYNVISDRLKAGWSVEDTLATPVNRKKARRGSIAAEGGRSSKAVRDDEGLSDGMELEGDLAFPFPFAENKAPFVPKTILRKRENSKRDAGGADSSSLSH